MNFKIHSHNIELEEGDRQYAEEKMGRLERHFGRILEGRLELEADALRRPVPVKCAHLHLHWSGVTMEAEVDGSTVREAIDLVVDKMDEKLRRHKERTGVRRFPEKLAET